MSRPFRIALAAAPFPRSMADGLAQVDTYAAEAAARGAKIVCFPESYLPGYRGPEGGETVAPHTPSDLASALVRARAIARSHRIALVLPMDEHDPESKAVFNVAVVIDAEGNVLGRQTKNQLDPTEDRLWVPGHGRTVFEVDGARFGVVICHEGFRYPETVRWAARHGAEIVFHPHLTGTNAEGGRRLVEWRAPSNPYYDSAIVCRALENTIFFASVNYALSFPDSATAIVGPEGELVARQPYGQAGVLVADVDLATATRALALRCRVDEYA
ncbi:MAG: carbon-nitrogen hydrolase family protein [Myxococcales bacterium]|nr:carbon-nitrogen hydrolase family protein [Myxococcales bacterium]